MNKRSAVTLLLCMVMILTLFGCAATTPRAKYYEQQKLLNAVQNTMVDHYELGLLDAKTFQKNDHYIQIAKRQLDQAKAMLPDGGDTFDHLINLADSIIMAYLNDYTPKRE